eukprot:scaffold1334_cov344-Prasinococcus_capsulatus_cf.AAC.22
MQQQAAIQPTGPRQQRARARKQGQQRRRGRRRRDDLVEDGRREDHGAQREQEVEEDERRRRLLVRAQLLGPLALHRQRGAHVHEEVEREHLRGRRPASQRATHHRQHLAHAPDSGCLIDPAVLGTRGAGRTICAAL